MKSMWKYPSTYVAALFVILMVGTWTAFVWLVVR